MINFLTETDGKWAREVHGGKTKRFHVSIGGIQPTTIVYMSLPALLVKQHAQQAIEQSLKLVTVFTWRICLWTNVASFAEPCYIFALMASFESHNGLWQVDTRLWTILSTFICRMVTIETATVSSHVITVGMT